MRKIIKNKPDLFPVEIANLELEPVIVKGSFDPPTTDAVAQIIPEATSPENPLVDEQTLDDAIAAADLSGVPAEVAAAALCELKENIEAAAIDNADLAARVAALESAESADDSRAILSAPSIRNEAQVDDGIERTLEEVPELEKKETIAADEGDVTETEK